MNVWRKQTVRYELKGKSVPKDTLKAKRISIHSKRFYGTLGTSDNQRKQVALCVFVYCLMGSDRYAAWHSCQNRSL